MLRKKLIQSFQTSELQKDSVVANFATTAKDDETYKVSYYNIDVSLLLDIKSPNPEFKEFKNDLLRFCNFSIYLDIYLDICPDKFEQENTNHDIR